jgi:hypothetical protein
LLIMRAKAAMALAILVLAAVPIGCGTSGPKRSVDARTEALRFFSVDAPAVAVLRPSPWSAVLALNDAAAGNPAWTQLRNGVLGPLLTAGVSPPELAKILQAGQDVAGTDPSAIAFGAATPGDLAAGRGLLVLASDQSDLLAGLLRRQAQGGTLKPAGKLDEASLYRSRDGAGFAVRDGVLISASRLAEVRAALQRRDGDTDLQLDEDVVNSLFDDLQTQGPLLVYANLAGIRDADPGMRQLADQTPWTGKLGPTAATAFASGGGVRIEDFSKTTSANFTSGELPFGTTPSAFKIDPSGAAALIPQPGPIRTLLTELAPISGEATGSSNEVRLHVTVGG